jgi:hypothetical protein
MRKSAFSFTGFYLFSTSTKKKGKYEILILNSLSLFSPHRSDLLPYCFPSDGGGFFLRPAPFFVFIGKNEEKEAK